MRHRFHSICPLLRDVPRDVRREASGSEPARRSRLRSVLRAGHDRLPGAAAGTGGGRLRPESGGGVRLGREGRSTVVRGSQGAGSTNCGRLAVSRTTRGWQGDLDRFFEVCFHPDTLRQVRFLRSVLDWRRRRDDRFLATLCLGALHGESHRSPNCFSNRMPRTISTKPGLLGPLVGASRIRAAPRVMCSRSSTGCWSIASGRVPRPGTAVVAHADARRCAEVFPALAGRVTDVITSPPYLDTTNYREDQWLRLWFLGGDAGVPRGRGDDRHYDKANYWKFIRASMKGLAPLLAARARIVLRIGGRRLRKSELREGVVAVAHPGSGARCAPRRRWPDVSGRQDPGERVPGREGGAVHGA